MTINFFELADGQLQSIVAGWKLVDLLTEGTLVEFEVPSTHELSVIVPGASGGTGIRLSRARIDPVLLWDHEPLTRTLDSGGRARFLVLPGWGVLAGGGWSRGACPCHRSMRRGFGSLTAGSFFLHPLISAAPTQANAAIVRAVASETGTASA